MLSHSGQMLYYKYCLDNLGLSDRVLESVLDLGSVLDLLWRNFRSVEKRYTNFTLDKITIKGSKLWESCVIE